MRVLPMQGLSDELFVISHINITQRKLNENKLEALSQIDSLTNIANRRYFDHFLQSEWQRCSRNNDSLSLIILDLDHFKHYNDTYGHVAGDQYLRHVGEILRKSVHRASDLVARYGGEEFAILLGNTDLLGALKIAEIIRCKVESLYKDNANIFAKTTLSAGVACFIPDVNDHPESLVLSADHALYLAKETGRNRIRYLACPIPIDKRNVFCGNCNCNKGKFIQSTEIGSCGRCSSLIEQSIEKPIPVMGM